MASVTSPIAIGHLALNALFRKSLLGSQSPHPISSCHHCTNMCWVVTPVGGESNKANESAMIIARSGLVTGAHHLSTQ